MANTYANFGTIFKWRGDTRSARSHWTQARDIYARIGMPHMVAKLDSCLADLPPDGPSSPAES